MFYIDIYGGKYEKKRTIFYDSPVCCHAVVHNY